MRENEAQLYIKAGFFPSETDSTTLKDLRTTFNNQRFWTCIRWLYNIDTKGKAEKLFRLIWDKKQVDTMLEIVDNVYIKRKELVKMEYQFEGLTTRIKSLRDELSTLTNNMRGETDYYDNPSDFDNRKAVEWEKILKTM